MYEGNRLVIAQAGAGKTVCSQTAIQELLFDDVLDRVIIFAPLKVCTLTWAAEWKKWEHLIAPVIATGSERDRIDAILSPASIVVMNLDNMKWFFEQRYHTHFDGILIDEISKLKDPGGKTFKAMRPHIPHFQWRCGMSATPVHEAGSDIYAQALFVDGGEALGRNKEKFLRTYFMQMDYKGYKWDFQPLGLERLASVLKDVVYVADTEDYEKSLPALEDIIVPVDMGEDAWIHYEAMTNSLLATIDNKEIEAPNLAVMQGKLQQICCGAAYDAEGEPVWIHKEKFNQLTHLVGAWQEPVAIAYQFAYELEMLKAMYPDAPVLGDSPVEAERAWNAGEAHVLLLHPASAGHGVNLQMGGCRLILMSPVWSADQWDQLVRRFRRRGQPSDVVYRYILLVENSVERIILGRHDEKMGVAESFVDHMRRIQNVKR
jgi:hypothetical protein